MKDIVPLSDYLKSFVVVAVSLYGGYIFMRLTEKDHTPLSWRLHVAAAVALIVVIIVGVAYKLLRSF